MTSSAEFMAEAIGVASVAAISYVSTNIDNLFLLSAYTVKPGYRPLYVKLAFACTCLCVLLISFGLAYAADDLPEGKLRFLGLIPITLGLYSLLMLLKRKGKSEAADEIAGPKSSAARTGFGAYLAFAFVLLANSSDSISLMIPVFADLKPILVIIAIDAALFAVVCMSFLAGRLVRQPRLKVILEQIATWVLPFVLIVIGLMIFLDEPREVFLEET